MSRFCYSFLFALSLPLLSITVAGCGTPENTVIEDTRSPAEIEAEMENYDEQMEQAASTATNS